MGVYLWLFLLGCGGGGDLAPTEIDDPDVIAISELIENINQIAGDSKAKKEDFQALFAGDVPKRKEIYEDNSISFPQVDPVVNVSGDTATAEVEVQFHGRRWLLGQET